MAVTEPRRSSWILYQRTPEISSLALICEIIFDTGKIVAIETRIIIMKLKILLLVQFNSFTTR